MGRYQKKPFKKLSLDPYQHIDIEKEYFEAMQDNEYEDFFDEIGEFSQNDEPEIVRQLRREELEGKLPLWMLEDLEEYDTIIPQTHLTYESNTISKKDIELHLSYEETFEIARKSFKSIASKNSDSIIFE